MNWFHRSAKSESIEKLRELCDGWTKKYKGDGLMAWYNRDDNELFLSFGDWAEHVDETLAEARDKCDCKVDYDYEVGRPDEREWIELL